MCYNAGTLQAFLDGEVADNEKSEIEKHLLSCDLCREALERVRKNQAFADTRLAGYLQSLGRPEVDTGTAWKRFNNNHLPVQGRVRPKKGVFAMLSRYRLAVTAAVMVLALTVSFSFSSVRSAASELLTVFRVEKVKTVSINPSDMTRIEAALHSGAGEVDIENLGKIEFIGNEAPGKVTLEEAHAAVDFQLKLPAEFPDGYRLQEIGKSADGTINFTLNTVNANQILKSFGSETFLPDELNGKTFSVKTPAQITAIYAGPNNENIFVGQSRSPELIAPSADVAAIRDALLALPFLPEDLRSQLAGINDWQHTFVVPSIGGTSREVDVAGVQGVFITSSDDIKAKGDDSCLIWQKTGVVYIIGGQLTMEQSLEMAESIMK